MSNIGIGIALMISAVPVFFILQLTLPFPYGLGGGILAVLSMIIIGISILNKKTKVSPWRKPFCNSCGVTVSERAKFCNSCGNNIS